MQTSQVSNPVNVLSGPAPAGKQSDANSPAKPFDQVLSREIADRRHVNESSKAKDTGKQPATAHSRPAEAKPAGEGKKDVDAPDEPDDTASLASEEMIALVANLTRIMVAAEASDAVPAPQEMQAGMDAMLVTGIADGGKTANRIASRLTAGSQLPDDGKERKPVSALAALLDEAGGTKQQTELAAAGKAELPAAAMADLVAKGQELLNGSAVKSAAAPDFTAAMKESLSAVTNTLQPALQAALPNAAHATEKLTPPVGSSAWDQALGQKVVWMVAGEHQSASLTLNPPDLGPLQVVLNVSNSQANATFIAAQPEVRQALEAALPKLRDMLGEAGIQLGQASVNSGEPNQHSAPDQRASQAAHRLDQAGSRNEAPVRVGHVQQASSGQGLVDTFV